MAQWSKKYTTLENVNGGNEYETGDHITKETVNVALNNTAYLQQTKVTAETNKGLVTQRFLDGVDLNTVLANGFYGCNGVCTNKPNEDSPGQMLVINRGDNWIVQFYINMNQESKASSNRVHTRGYDNSKKAWSPWLRTDVQPALYNLGAYDSIEFNDDGTATITRQTGYKVYDESANVKGWGAKVGYRYSLGYINDCVSHESSQIVCKANVQCFTADANWSDNTQISLSVDGGNQIGIMLPDYNVTENVNAVKQWLGQNPLSVQYKLSTSYTEKVILNQPLLDLPQQGTQWLREEWEKGLNLFDYDNRIKNAVIDGSGNTGYNSLFPNYFAVFAKVEPNTPYTLSNVSDGNYHEYNANKRHIRYYESQGSTMTFTTSADCYYIGKDMEDTHPTPMLNKGSHALPYQPYKGEIIRQSSLENQVPILGNQGSNKVMLGCKYQWYNGTGSVRYIYIAKWDELNDVANDSGIHIKGIIGGWMFTQQSIIDVVAYFREGFTFKGEASQKQTIMDIVITDAGKVYLRLYSSQYSNYNIDISCGKNGTIEYTGDILTSVDGTIQAALYDSVETRLPYFPLNGGLKANTSTTDWGVSTGSEVASFNDITGGSFKFRRDCPSNGKMSLVIDGNVYVNEGQDKVLTSADVSNKLDADATSITNAQGNWFTSESGHIDFGTSGNQTRIYSSDRPRWYKNGINQGEIALTSDIMPKEVAIQDAKSVKVDAGHLYMFSVYLEDDGEFYTGFIYVPNNYLNACRSAIIATFGNYKYLVACWRRSSASAQGTLMIAKLLIDDSAGTRTNSYFDKVFKMF